jgi:type II secretory pathway component PulM
MNLLPRFQAFWDGIAARERALILFGVAVLLPVGLYLYVWQPVVAERARLSVRVVQLRGELAQLRASGEEVKRLRAQAPARGGVPLEVAARQAALRFGLPDAAGGLTAQGGDRLLVNLDGVAFDAWLRWLGELGGQGVSLVACQIESLPTPGLVRIKATLGRAAS